MQEHRGTEVKCRSVAVSQCYGVARGESTQIHVCITLLLKKRVTAGKQDNKHPRAPSSRFSIPPEAPLPQQPAN